MGHELWLFVSGRTVDRVAERFWKVEYPRSKGTRRTTVTVRENSLVSIKTLVSSTSGSGGGEDIRAAVSGPIGDRTTEWRRWLVIITAS